MRRGAFPRRLLLAGGLLLAACQQEGPVVRANADSTRAAITLLEERLRQGAVAGDTVLLGSLWAPEYLSTSGVGHTSTRAEALMAYGARLVTVDSAIIQDLDIRPYGSSAVSLGYMTWSGSAAGSRFSSRVRFQHVWVHTDGVWRLVASQLTNQPTAGPPSTSAR